MQSHPPIPIAVQAIGILCGLGIGRDVFHAALSEGEGEWMPGGGDGPGPDVPTARIPAFDLKPFLNAPKTYLDPHSRAVLAALCLAHQGIDRDAVPPAERGLLLGTAWGNTESMVRFFADAVRKGPRLVKPFLFPHTYANTSAALGCMEWGLEGPHQVLTSGLTASGQAILEAVDLLREGRARRLFAGGADVLSAERLHTMPNLAAAAAPSAPFDPSSAGCRPGEAAVILALTVATASPTGLALLDGALDAADSPAQRPATVRRVVDDALRRAGIAPADLAFACVSADGNAACDRALGDGLAAALAPERSRPLALVAPAALCGNTGGATDALLCAAIDAVFAARLIPATGTTIGKFPLPAPLQLPAAPAPLPEGPAALALSLDAGGAACALVLARNP